MTRGRLSRRRNPTSRTLSSRPRRPPTRPLLLRSRLAGTFRTLRRRKMTHERLTQQQNHTCRILLSRQSRQQARRLKIPWRQRSLPQPHLLLDLHPARRLPRLTARLRPKSQRNHLLLQTLALSYDTCILGAAPLSIILLYVPCCIASALVCKTGIPAQSTRHYML